MSLLEPIRLILTSHPFASKLANQMNSWRSEQDIIYLFTFFNGIENHTVGILKYPGIRYKRYITQA